MLINMIIYDISTAVRLYIPYAMITGLIALSVFAAFLYFRDRKKLINLIRDNRKSFILLYILYIYCFVMVSLTLLSREPGSRDSLDLKPFSTFSKNMNYNVYPIENIMLFIPFGFLLPLIWKRFQNAFWCMAAGFILSLSIEINQYYTKRGYFQTDDIITNIVGTMVGFVIYFAIKMLKKVIINKD